MTVPPSPLEKDKTASKEQEGPLGGRLSLHTAASYRQHAGRCSMVELGTKWVRGPLGRLDLVVRESSMDSRLMARLRFRESGQE